YALKADIPGAADTSGFATKAEVAAVKASIPAAMDLSKYALKTDIPAAMDLSAYAKKAEIPAAGGGGGDAFPKGTRLLMLAAQTDSTIPPGWGVCKGKTRTHEYELKGYLLLGEQAFATHFFDNLVKQEALTPGALKEFATNGFSSIGFNSSLYQPKAFCIEKL
ncbi:MAG: hypothetical protein LBT92_00270, partial [Rickettsiales bacterium]|nr:hypothetical protein [Rickettsiales bacterium]